jgi:hypothetical protein
MVRRSPFKENKMKLYTSYYGNRNIAKTELLPVGISQGNPRFRLPYAVACYLRELAPARSIWALPKESFDLAYRKQLERRGVAAIMEQLESTSTKYGGRDLVLLCFEDLSKRNAWCHRTTFAQWWFEKTGNETKELLLL